MNSKVVFRESVDYWVKAHKDSGTLAHDAIVQVKVFNLRESATMVKDVVQLKIEPTGVMFVNSYVGAYPPDFPHVIGGSNAEAMVYRLVVLSRAIEIVESQIGLVHLSKAMGWETSPFLASFCAKTELADNERGEVEENHWVATSLPNGLNSELPISRSIINLPSHAMSSSLNEMFNLDWGHILSKNLAPTIAKSHIFRLLAYAEGVRLAREMDIALPE